MSINKILDHDVDVIKDQLDGLIKKVEKQYNDTYQALTKKDYKLAQKVVDNDKKINEQQNEFISTVLWKIAKQNMVAGDLRFAIGSVLIAREIRKIASYAKAVSYFVLDYEPDIKYTEIIEQNFDIVLQMLDLINNLIDRSDVDLSKKVEGFEEEVNQAFVQTRSKIIDRMRHSESDQEALLLYTSLRQLKKLERAADHMVGIQEILNFIRTGKFQEISPRDDESDDVLDETQD